MTATSDMTADRKAMVHAAMKLIDRRGEAVTKAALASETGSSRARIDALFPEETDLFAAIVDEWFAPDTAIMEEVVASDLSPRNKLYEFFARRFAVEKERYDADPALFALYVELGTANFDQVEGYIALADHYLAEIIAQAQAEGYFEGLKIDHALSLVNQMTMAYTSPALLMMIGPRLSTKKLSQIIDTMFAGLRAR